MGSSIVTTIVTPPMLSISIVTTQTLVPKLAAQVSVYDPLLEDIMLRPQLPIFEERIFIEDLHVLPPIHVDPYVLPIYTG